MLVTMHLPFRGISAVAGACVMTQQSQGSGARGKPASRSAAKLSYLIRMHIALRASFFRYFLKFLCLKGPALFSAMTTFCQPSKRLAGARAPFGSSQGNGRRSMQLTRAQGRRELLFGAPPAFCVGLVQLQNAAQAATVGGDAKSIANSLLSSFGLPQLSRAEGFTKFEESKDGYSLEYPKGWVQRCMLTSTMLRYDISYRLQASSLRA